MILDILTNLDKNLIFIIQTYGFWSYPLLFLVIFLETGLVVTPFLPGDSLLFAAGTIASKGLINVFLVFLIATSAAIIGDTVNYSIGKFIGKNILKRKLIKEEYLIRTQNFYDKYGAKTIILARFVPIIRTFAPFVAGIGKMKYSKFFMFNVVGGILWTALLTFAGFFFGNISFVKDNLSTVILAIIFISFLPIIIELIKSKMKKKDALH